MNLFADDDNQTMPQGRTLTDDQVRRIRKTIREGTKTDRYIIKQDLLAVQVANGEATDNSTHIGARIARHEREQLERFAKSHGTYPSELVREAVRYAIKNDLFSQWHPHRTDEDE
jgi:hypothetical protein